MMTAESGAPEVLFLKYFLIMAYDSLDYVTFFLPAINQILDYVIKRTKTYILNVIIRLYPSPLS